MLTLLSAPGKGDIVHIRLPWFRAIIAVGLVASLAVPHAAKASPSICDAIAGNLVQNCGFETGDFTGWTTGEISFSQYVDTAANSVQVNSGLYAAQIAGFSFGPDTLTQTIATTVGQLYSLSFYRYQGLFGPTISLDVLWNGNPVFSELNPGPPEQYQQFSAQVVGTGSDTIQFVSANDPDFTFLDDVTLSSVPGPATLALLGLGLAGLGFLRRKQ